VKRKRKKKPGKKKQVLYRLKAEQGLPVRQVLLKEKRVKDRKKRKLKKQVKRDQFLENK
jgi:hypothetical protein